MLRRDDVVRQGIRESMLLYRRPTLEATLEEIASEGYGMRNTDDVGPVRVQIHTAFAADMVVLLRSHIGTAELSQANLLLVEREYHRVCRQLNVRYVDVAVHRQHVMNAFFTEDVFDVVGNTRSRIPRWLRTLLGHNVPRALGAT